MARRDRDRLKVLHEVQKRHISQQQAATELGCSTRWVRQLLKRVTQEGDQGVIHRLRGRPSNRRLPGSVKQLVISIVTRQQQARQWHDYGPTLAAEELAADHGLRVGRETLRKWLTEAGLWKPQRARLERVHQWRTRRERTGELVQWDTSEHAWLEARGPKLYLIAMIDDATSCAVARFVEHDSTAANMALLRTYLEAHGRPVAYYTDKASLFQTTEKRRRDQPGPPSDPRELPPTQIGRALHELGIAWIPAHSPQAKGRVERFFGTAQDRLVKGLRKVRARTLEQANAYLTQTYLPGWNQRFTQAPANVTDAHRPLSKNDQLDSVLSRVEQRQVASDYTVRWHGAVWQIPRAALAAGMRGAAVLIEQRADGSVWLRWQDQRIPLTVCTSLAQTSPLPTVAPSPKPPVDRQQARQRQLAARQKWQASWARQPNLTVHHALEISNARD